MRYQTKRGDVLDAICYQHYGYHEGTVEAALEANPELCGQPLILPAGLTIELPTLSDPVQADTLKLWT